MPAALVGLVSLILPAGTAEAERSPAAATLNGTVTWVGGPDSRATLGVGACPADEQAPNCSSLRTASVAADGSYSLDLPFTGPRTWNVAAFITTDGSLVIGPVTEVNLPRSTRNPLPLTVSARPVGLKAGSGRYRTWEGSGAERSSGPTGQVAWRPEPT